MVFKLSEIWVSDRLSEILNPRFGYREKPIPDPGSKGQKALDHGFGSAVGTGYAHGLFIMVFSEWVTRSLRKRR